MSLMIERYYAEDSKWQMFYQFHDEPDWTKGETWETYTVRIPPHSLLYMNGTLGFYLNSIDLGKECIARCDVEKGVWIDLVLHLKWSMDYDGFVEICVNGEPVTPFNGIDYKFYRPTEYNVVGNALKIGLYRDSSIESTSVVYFDEVRIGSSYEEVTP